MTKSTFRVWIPEFGQGEEDGRDVVLVYGDAEQAAAEFVERYEARSSEYPVASGKESRNVVVKSKANGQVSTWRVDGETRPRYRAHLIAIHKINPTESKP